MKTLLRIHDLYVAKVVTVMVLATWVVLVGLDAVMAGVNEQEATRVCAAQLEIAITQD